MITLNDILNKPVDDFTLPAFYQQNLTQVSLSHYKNNYVVLIFYPLDFTFVCPTELTEFSKRRKEFDDLNCVVFYISVDSHYSHKTWCEMDPSKGGLSNITWPMLSDLGGKVSDQFGLLSGLAGTSRRATAILNKNHVLKCLMVYEDNIGRNVDEVLRVVGNMKYMDEDKDVKFCPCDYKISK